MFREVRVGEESSACSLARHVFDESVAPTLTAVGVEEFYLYAEPGAFAARLASNHVALVAAQGDELVGIVEIRHSQHISMLFVPAHQRGKGTGSRLLQRALALCSPGPVTVHAAPDAVTFYTKHGFSATAPEQVIDGLRFVPMATSGSRQNRSAPT